MDHSVQVLVGSSLGRVMFGLSDISGRFGLGRVWFGSGGFRIRQFLVKYTRHVKTNNFVENSGRARFSSAQFGFQVHFLGEYILDVGSGMDSGR